MSVIDSLRSPSTGAGSEDDTRRSESVMPEPNVTPSHVSAHQSDAVTLNRDDAEGSGTTENRKLTSVFSLSRLSKIIDGPTSPLENRNAGDAEENHTEEASGSGKKDNDDNADNDDKFSVRETHVISEISARISEEEEEQDGKEEKEEKIEEKRKEGEEKGEEEQDGGGGGKEGEAEEGEEQKDEKVGEREEQQEGGEEEKEEREEQDGGGKEEGEEREEQEEEKELEKEIEEEDEARQEVNVAETQINSVKRSLDFNKQDVSDGGKNISTDIRKSSDDVQVDVDEFDDHSDSGSASHDVNKSLPEEEETRHESESSSDSGLQVRIDVLQTISKTGDECDEAQHEGEAANILLGTEEAGMKVSSSPVVETVWTVADDEKNCADVTQDSEGEGGDDVEKEHCGSDLSLLTQTKSSGDKEATEDTRMETDGENETLNITQKSGGETECVETHMECSGGKDDGDVFQTESGGEEESVDLIQKDQLSLHTAHGLENTHNISDTKQKLELHPDDSRKSEKHQGAAVKQTEIRPKNLQDKSPSADGSESKASSTSDGNPEIQRLKEKHGDEKTEVKHHEVRRSAQTQKRATPDSQAHLSEEDIKELLKFLDTESLLRLDFIAAHLEDVSSEEVAELQDFQQTLEHLLQKNRNPETNNPSLQSIQTVLTMLKDKLIPVIADASVDKRPDPSQTKCVSEVCVRKTKDTPTSEQDMGKDDNSDSLISKSNDQEVISDKTPVPDHTDAFRLDRDAAPQTDASTITEEFLEPEPSQNEGVLHPHTVLVDEFPSDVFTYVVKESARARHAMYKVVMSLPDNIRPGPDLYGLPWETVIFTATLGLITFLLFTCRFVQVVKSRLYCSKERRMGQTVAELLEEKCKVLETLSECEHKFKKLEAALQNGGLSAQDSEREDLEVISRKLEEANAQMKSDLEKMQEELDTQEQLRKQQKEQLTKLEEMLKTLEKEATERKSQLEQDKTTLKIHEMNTERLQKKLQETKEENSMLLESKAQLEQEAEGWKERLSELEEEKRMSETSHSRMMENCVNKDEHIKSLTECLLMMRDWDSEEESSVNDTSGSENRNSSDFMQKQKVQKLIHAAKMSADLKAVEEDKDRVFAKLTDEIQAKEDLQVSLEQLQRDRETLESESSMYSSEIEKLQHKLQIMSEMYQEKELKLHRMLTMEEKERSQKEEQLNKAGKKISLATDELNSYRQRAKELEEELEKTNQTYRNQIAAHEKKAHDNWLAARAADRDLTDVKRENSVLRQRLTDWQFKLELMEKNPQARAPLFRGERSPFGPSPLGRPPSETRPFLSPPTLMDGPPRVSPQFPMMPGGRAPPGGVEGDRSVSYSEGGSPTWERERERERERRSLGPQGPDPGLVYRRPLSAPFLRAPLPPETYYSEKPESFRGEGAGFRENGIRDSGRSIPGADIRAGPLPPPPFPPMDPRDPHFPRRGYRPDFFPPPPPLAMRGPPLPPGAFPRIPLPPHMAFPPMRPPADHASLEPPSRPSPPGSEQLPEQPPSAHDII